jgi:hypothetical protein
MIAVISIEALKAGEVGERERGRERGRGGRDTLATITGSPGLTR